MAATSSEHPQVHHPHPQHPSSHHPQPPLHHPMTREHSRDHREHDVHGLRMALGSILSPKRMSTPSSRASSGTASPCPAHFGPGLVHAYHPGPSHLHTPIESHDESDILKQTMVAQQEDSISHEHASQTTPRRPSPPRRERSQHTPPPILTTSNVHSLSPQQTQSVKDAHGDSERVLSKQNAYTKDKRGGRDDAERESLDHPRGLNAYIATLQSGRAWDALVHGNMS